MILARYPLSYNQEGIWLSHELHGQTSEYNTCEIFSLRGPLSPTRLTAAVGRLAQRHDSLRTRFVTVRGEPLQVIDDRWRGRVTVERAEGGLDRDLVVEEFVHRAGHAVFDLESGPLLRVDLLELDDEDRLLAVTIHHIVTDGWSIKLMLDELSRIYRAPEIEEAGPAQYGEFAVWQREALRGGELDDLTGYWVGQVAGAPTELRLSDRRRVDRSAETVEFRLSAATVGRLGEFARSYGATIFMALLAGFVSVLSQAAGSGVLLVGVPVAGRSTPNFADSLGFFANLVPLRADLSDDPTVADLIGQIRGVVLAGLAHQDLPFASMVAAVNPQRDPNGHPLVQVVFQFGEASFESALRLPGVEVRRMPVDQRETSYSLTMDLTSVIDGLDGRIIFQPGAVDHDVARTLATRFARVADAMPLNPRRPVSAVLASCSQPGSD